MSLRKEADRPGPKTYTGYVSEGRVIALAVRMKDIASDMGVSLMTVSKALRGHTDISEETRERILRRAQQLKYQHNWIVRSLASRQTFIVGLVIPDLMHSSFAEIAIGLTQKLSPFGYQIVLANSDENAETSGGKLNSYWPGVLTVWSWPPLSVTGGGAFLTYVNAE
jgi:transcriptional regulator with XRE-family HTH domain